MASRVGGVPQAVVYAAWLQALDRPEEGIKTLEKMLAQAGESPDESAAEAADVLAMLYLARGEKDKAKKAVEFGLKVLGYRDVKHGYVLALLRGRLKSDVAAGEAEKLYHDAERLRADEKFLEAGKVYARVRAMCPTKLPSPSGRGAGGEGVSPENPDARWGHAAGFRIGQCYLGLNRPTEALAWWQAFVKESPAGPWRGQARAALVDLALEFQLDLKAATEHALAAAAVLEKELDADAAPSWHAAAYDIYLRQGIVSLVDRRYEAALQGFEQAKQHVPSPSGRGAGGEGARPTRSRSPLSATKIQEGLDRLIAAARDHLKLLPDDLTSGDDRATTALVLGSIYSLLQEPEVAKGWFSMPLNGATRSRSPAHRSFAYLGIARVAVATNVGLERVLSLYESSLKEYPGGHWHDETLYGAAWILQNVMMGKSGATPRGSGGGATGAVHKPPVAQRASDVDRASDVVEVKSRALPYWRKLVAVFPDSARCEDALYNAGVLCCELARVSAAEKAEEMAREADSFFSRLCAEYPKSVFAGDALVRQIDFALERRFDLSLATSLADKGVRWAKGQDVRVHVREDGRVTRDSLDGATRAIRDHNSHLPEWAHMPRKSASSLLDDLYNLHLRGAVVAYVGERFDNVAEHLEEAGPARPTDGMEADFDLEKFGLHILLVCSQRKEPSWCRPAIDAAKSPQQRLALKLADTYLHCQRPERAETLYRSVLEGVAPLGRPSRAVESYCLMQMALGYSNRRIKHEQSVAYYGRFLRREYADLPWAATAILRLAVLEYNTTQDPKRSIPYYKHVIAKYPDHPDAERALYFLSVDAVHAGDKALAENSCREFVRRYPNSGWRSHVQDLLKDEVPRLQGTERRSQP